MDTTQRRHKIHACAKCHQPVVLLAATCEWVHEHDDSPLCPVIGGRANITKVFPSKDQPCQ